MTPDWFPREPGDRRAVIVLEQHDVDRCSRTGDTQILTSPQTYVLVMPISQKDDSSALANIRDAGLDQPGSILVQSPYHPDEYAEASGAMEQFALAKHMLFSNFCQLLGATRVEVKQIEIVSNGSTHSGKVEGGAFVFKGDASLKVMKNDSVSSQLHLVDEYDGGAADLEAANGLLRAHRLTGDSNMRSLLLARTSASNPIRRRAVTLDLSSEANRNVDVAGRLKLPKVGVNAKYEGVFKQSKQYKLQLEITFS